MPAFKLSFRPCIPGLLVLLPLLSVAQDGRFTKTVFSDSFTADSGRWEVRSDAAALYLVQEDEYLLRRMDRSEGAVLCRWINPCDPYRLTASLKIDKTSGGVRQAGLVFMMQEDHAGGFLLEVNTKKQYRVRQVVQGSYRILTGTTQSQGWTAGAMVAAAGESNLLQVTFADKSYELFINGTLVKAFAEPAYKLGRFGFSVGPSSTARAQFITVSAEAGCVPDAGDAMPVAVQEPVDSLLVIRRLEAEISALKSEIKVLRDSLKKKNTRTN